MINSHKVDFQATSLELDAILFPDYVVDGFDLFLRIAPADQDEENGHYEEEPSEDLDEIKNLARPPNNVKLTLECVAIMLGERKVEWADVRKLLAKADFIPSILNFDADKLSSNQISRVHTCDGCQACDDA